MTLVEQNTAQIYKQVATEQMAEYLKTGKDIDLIHLCIYLHLYEQETGKCLIS